MHNKSNLELKNKFNNLSSFEKYIFSTIEILVERKKSTFSIKYFNIQCMYVLASDLFKIRR